MGLAGSCVSKKGLLVPQAKEMRKPITTLSLYGSRLLEGRGHFKAQLSPWGNTIQVSLRARCFQPATFRPHVSQDKP